MKNEFSKSLTSSHSSLAMKPINSLGANQRGTVMFFSLVLLAALSIYGLSSMRGALTEERISMNIQDRHLANEGAESALRFGERTLASFPDSFDFAYYNTLHGEASPDLEDWDYGGTKKPSYGVPASEWSSPTAVPRYKLEYFSAGSDLETGDGRNAKQKEVASTAYYRIFGYGEGKSDTASAIVVSISIKR